MTPAQLLSRARVLHDERQLPLQVIEALVALDSHPRSHLLPAGDLAALSGRMEEYDPYAGAGCFCDSASTGEILGRIARIMDGI